jgi:aryl-alcohol dehydrogenase-like predicted oxidoreductase
MLKYAAEHGIMAIDTASAYGEAEKIVGQFVKNAGRKKLEIITKIRPGALYSVQPDKYCNTLKQNVKNSLANLNVDCVDGCLFHNAEYAGNSAALEALARLKRDRLVKKTGISVYTPAEFAAAMDSPHVDIIQIPYNLMDTRLDGLLARTDKEIHARSIFLQGLLLMDEDDVPKGLWEAKPYLRRIDSFCEYYGLTRMQAMVNFIKTQPKIDKIVFGVDNMEQLKQVEDAFRHTTADPVALRELSDEFTVLDEKMIMPNLWRVEYR